MNARDHFPNLKVDVRGHRLAYLDNAATTHKPLAVIEATDTYYREQNSNVHRGVHTLSQIATDLFDQSRAKLAKWINASPEEVIFTKGCTEAINLVATSYGGSILKPGDRILLSHMEHHANIVPWFEIAQRTGATIESYPITDEGEVDLGALQEMLDERVKIVGIVHISNAIGTVNPVAEIVRLAHAVGAKVIVDGAQSLTHLRVDVRELGADFYTMSGHKMYGPTGIGALYGKRELLEAMPPYQTGGSMIRTVAFDKITYAEIPEKFEPGTPNIAGVIGWGAAIDFLSGFDLEQVAAEEIRLAEMLRTKLAEIDGIRFTGTAKDRAGIVSFVADWAHAHDIGTLLDMEGVAVRTGHHCCMPLMKRFGVAATTRASFAMYSTEADVEQCVTALRKAKAKFS